MKPAIYGEIMSDYISIALFGLLMALGGATLIFGSIMLFSTGSSLLALLAIVFGVGLIWWMCGV